MSANLPINWADKKNSPLLADFIAKYGAEYCMTAEEINQLRNAVNEMAEIQKTTFLGVAEPIDTPAGTGAGYWEVITPGTYTRFGGKVLGVDERGLIVRDPAGAFKLSKVPFSFNTYAKIVDLVNKADLVVGKNRFNKNDANIILDFYLENSGIPIALAGHFVTHYIPIKAGETLYCNNGWMDANVSQVLYDVNKIKLIATVSTRKMTATVEGFVRFSVNGSVNDCQVELGTVATSYEDYYVSVPKNNIISINESALPKNVLKTTDFGKTVPKMIIGKNKFNKNDTSTINLAYFDAPSGTKYIGMGNTAITHYIPIKGGDTYYSQQMWNGSGVHHELTDIDKLNPVYVAAVGARTVTATIDGFVRISLAVNNFNLVQVELGTAVTIYEAYYTAINKEDIYAVNEYAIPVTIARIADLGNTFVKLEVGKNRFNKNDINNILGAYLQDSNGLPIIYGEGFITHYIPIKAGETLICNNGWVNPNVSQCLYSEDKTLLSFIISAKQLTATVDGFIRFSVNPVFSSTLHTTQVERGAVTEYQPYEVVVPINKLPALAISTPSSLIILTVKRYGVNGVDANFCGLNAIGDALNSIIDATEKKRYKIIADGVFLFTNPNEFIYKYIPFDEPTIVVAKKWVDIEGFGIDRTVIAVELATNSIFPSGKGHMDYQPIMLNTTSKISNLSIIAKNCRYAIHSDLVDSDSISEVENCYLIHKGNSTINGNIPDGTTIGTGVGNNSKWVYSNCEITSLESVVLGIHSSTDPSHTKGAAAKFISCKINGSIAPNYIPNDLAIDLVFEDCTYSDRTELYYQAMLSNLVHKYADDSFIKVNINKPLLFSNGGLRGQGLRIKSKTIGITSSVLFDINSTAFNSIIGDSNSVVEISKYSFKKKHEVFYKSGGVGLSAFSVSNIEVNELGINSLGKRLGNCLVTNKTLTVIVDGTSCNIVFNENLTAQSNAYVIAKITAVIGAFSDVDTYSIGKEYYPLFDSVQEMKNVDVAAIKSGMGVVFVSQNAMRMALNSDNRVDAICIDDTSPNTYGRTQRGKIYSSNSGQRFSTLENNTNVSNHGDEFGISITQPGYFDKTASPKFLRAYYMNSLKFIN